MHILTVCVMRLKSTKECNARRRRRRRRRIKGEREECVPVALIIDCAKRMRRIVLSSCVCPAVPYFSTLPHKRYEFG